jgi:alkaline phosphatase D
MSQRPAFVLQIGDFDHRDPQTLEEMRMMHREVRGGGVASAAGRDFRTGALPDC